MSFRHTYITEFLYKANSEAELKKIEDALQEFGSVFWRGREGMGYFYGVIKDLNGQDTKLEEENIIKKLADLGVRIKIVFE